MSRTFGILAFPASHSFSPQIHNAAFEALGIDAHFERYEIAPENLEKFLQENLLHTRKIEGLAVSIPHKETILRFVENFDDSVQKIGAANTIFWQNEMLCATNTDCIGFLEALVESYTPKGKRALVIGAGGAAKAIIYALLHGGIEQVTIANRTAQKALDLALSCGVQAKHFDDLRAEDYDLVVNTTPLGMTGEYEGISPLPKSFWKPHLTAFDIVYIPKETEFLKNAKAAGCTALSGEHMFLYQAMAQFKIWTGKEAPREVMENIIKS